MVSRDPEYMGVYFHHESDYRLCHLPAAHPAGLGPSHTASSEAPRLWDFWSRLGVRTHFSGSLLQTLFSSCYHLLGGTPIRIQTCAIVINKQKKN